MRSTHVILPMNLGPKAGASSPHSKRWRAKPARRKIAKRLEGVRLALLLIRNFNPKGIVSASPATVLIRKVFFWFRGGFCFLGGGRCREDFELMIHVDDQLAHDGGQGNFARLVPFFESRVERRQDGIATARAER